MTAQASLAETAIINTTGQTVRVIRRRGVLHDEQIMRALELAGHFVIGTPAGFRYRKHGKKRFTRPEPATVYVIDDEGRATAALPGPYFAKHYTIAKGGDQ